MVPVMKNISGRRNIQVWVNHHNCHHGCKHCFLGAAPKESQLEATRATCATTTALGFDTHIYTTNQATEEFLELKKLGDCLTPNLQVNTENVLDNLQEHTAPVGLSLMSTEADIHDAITRKGNHEKALKTLAYLEEQKIRFGIWTAVYSRNYDRLPEFFEFILEHGAHEVFVNKLVMLGNAMTLPKELFLNTAQVARALRDTLEVILDFRDRGLNIIMQAAWGPLLTPFEVQMFRTKGPLAEQGYCPGAQHSFGVDPVSKGVWPCYFTFTVDALKIGRLDEENGLVLTEDWPYHPERIGEPCKSCDLMPACAGGCRGMSMVEHLVRSGELDFYPGFEDCPVHLGITVPEGLRTEAQSLQAFEKNKGIAPYH